jgi:hypothetical protein
MWSIGIVILEIICGTDIVLATGCFKNITNLLEECAEHVDPSTYELLDQLLNKGHDEAISKYVNETLADNPEVVAESIRAMDAAVEGVASFQKMQLSVLKMIDERPQYAREKYNLAHAVIVRSEPEELSSEDYGSQEDQESTWNTEGKLCELSKFQFPLVAQMCYWRKLDFLQIKIIDNRFTL